MALLRCCQGVSAMKAAQSCARLGWEQAIMRKPSKFISAAGNRCSVKRNNDIEKVLQYKL
jgi:hypothetical protein